MTSSLSELSDRSFDLLVVGGGICGAWSAYEAALRGLKTALIERQDWGSGTSSASSKLIHGGLRYLEQGRVGLVRQALRERHELLRNGPHRFQTLRFGVPVEHGRGPAPWKLRAALWLYDHLAGSMPDRDRRENLSAIQAEQRWPFLRSESRTAAATYTDVQTDDARLVLELVFGARDAGALAVREVQAVEPVTDSRGHLSAVRAESGGNSLEIRARSVIWAVGPWLEARWGGSNVRRTRGVHLVMPALPTDQALLLRTPQDGRVFFLIPWYGRTLLGTTDTDWQGDPAQVQAEPADIAYLLHAANHHLATPWSESDVIRTMAGVRVMREVPGAAPSSLGREAHVLEPVPGLLVPVGGKLTSARLEAARLVDRAEKHLGRKPAPWPTTGRPLPWAPTEPWPLWLTEQVREAARFGLDAPAARQLARRYGTQVREIWRRLEQFPDQARRLHAGHLFIEAELHHAREFEDARTSDDLLRRRVPLALLEAPGQRVEI